MNYGQDGSKPDSLFGKQKTILLVLVVVALASVFLLPQFVSKPWILDGSVDDRQVPDTSALAVSPSTAAEKTQYRQEAQSLLAKIIPIRDKLKLESVEVWSPVEYQIALGQIDDGDDKYSYGDYRESLESYQLALSGFETLDQLGQQKLSDSLSSGFEAIENLNVTGATVASELATVIAGQNEQVRELASRAISLPAVAEQLEKGDLEKSKGNPLAAQDAYQQAV
ncbi:MAG: hypothetical protein ACI9H8_000242, partial [Lysobacterales bacterium]